MFPVLSSTQIARIASLGVIRPITRGEVLIDGGQTNVPFFVLKAGEIEVIRPSALDEIPVAPGEKFRLLIAGPHPGIHQA